MESEKGKNMFLKRHGLYAMWLTERLSGWHRQWLGRLAAGRVIIGLSLLRLKAVTGFTTKLAALYVNHRTVPTTGPQTPAKVLSPQTPLRHHCLNQHLFIGYFVSAKHYGKSSRDVKKISSCLCQLFQLLWGSPILSPDREDLLLSVKKRAPTDAGSRSQGGNADQK